MRTVPWLLILMVGGSAAAAEPRSAEASYQQAREAYYGLKGDANRRKFRHHWLHVARRFDAVASQFPKSSRAPDALFTAAELYAELSRFSRLDEDLRAAIGSYEKLVERHGKHRLADDGLLALAHIHLNRRGDVAAARELLHRAGRQVAMGDRRKEIQALLADLPKAAPKARVVKALKPVAPPKGTSVLSAIAKVAAPPDEAPASRAPASPQKAKSLPSVAPEVGSERRSPFAEDVDEHEAPGSSSGESVLTQLQEKLRDVRVGSSADRSEEMEVDPAQAKARLENVAKQQGRQAELTLAEQLGLKVRRVVLDAGHGGHDSGAIGMKGTKEKDVALAITKKLARLLTEAGLEVVLTRDDDSFVKLEDRTRLANEAKGDLFISIHCNSSPTHKLRGVETYTLNTSADRYAIRLAARENASSEKGISDLQYILADLATKANTEESSRLANHVQRSLVQNLSAKYQGIRDLGHKEALFFVLLGARMPSILVETSFLSHPEEEKLLASPGYQSEVAKAIASAIGDFLSDRARLARAP